MFAKSFIKIALTKQFLERAASRAAEAKKFVSYVSEREGLLPGPLAGKYHAQEQLFLGALKKGISRKKRKLLREKGLSQGELRGSTGYWKHFGKRFRNQEIKPQEALELSAIKARKGY